jgi:hypothetical protein
MNETISVDYLEQQRKLHENPNYGVASLSFDLAPEKRIPC